MQKSARNACPHHTPRRESATTFDVDVDPYVGPSAGLSVLFILRARTANNDASERVESDGAGTTKDDVNDASDDETDDVSTRGDDDAGDADKGECGKRGGRG